MLTYSYECGKCRKTYDVLQKITEAHLTKCPVCASVKFHRVISAPMLKTKSKTFLRKSMGTAGEFGPEL